MRRVSTLAVAALLAATLSQAGAGSDGSGSAFTLLSLALSAPATVSYTGVVEVVRMGRHAAEASVYNIEHRAPDLTRRVYSAPSPLLGDSIISRGDLDFSIEARHHRIVETRDDAADDRVALTDNGALLRKNYQAVESGSETFDGRQTVDVLLINRYSRRTAMLVRIDRGTKIVLDKQRFDPQGALVSEVRFEQVRYAAVAPGDFTLPKAYPVVQGSGFGELPRDPDQAVRTAGFAARKPQSLPQGFSPVEGDVVDFRGVRTVHLLYSDGLRTVSLFESATATTVDMQRFRPQSVNVRGRSAEYAEDGAIDILAWSDARLHYALVGECDLRELERLAGAITP